MSATPSSRPCSTSPASTRRPAASIGIAGSLQTLASTKYLAGAGTIDNSLHMLRAALRLFRQANHLAGEAEARHDTAILLRRHGNYQAAITEHQAALDAVVAMNAPMLQTRIESAYATTLHQHGDTRPARAMAERALRTAEQIRVPYRIARAQTCLADCVAATDPATAHRLWRQALHTFTELGADVERADIQQHLSTAERAATPA